MLDHRLGQRFNLKIAPTTDFADELPHRTKSLYDNRAKINVILHQIDEYYNKKAKASP